MKKQAIVLLGVTLLGLAGCSQSTQNDTTNDKKQTTTHSTSTAKSDSTKLNVGADDKVSVLPKTLNFKSFNISQIKVEAETKQQVELEIGWLNQTTDDRLFSDVGEVAVYQNGTKLKLTEQDDDFLDHVGPNENEDFELSYRLRNTKDDLQIRITPKNDNETSRQVKVAFN
ncbi:hypothetical protein AYR54_09120 [Loigolactobacillus backii]|uniref:hypothetical protein n=1 Tax=Loigolactobacillus backii TaxID=375175 RepID=UPI0007F0AE18|nr:hypothetical protein [Loigolactobacillus backii]ANK60505.1 hypothetical protein AYR52_09720 [Loigolactobacillus backii]ANK65380.1 hypothetical protein AYR54_09120 [Loigolactobacillus backii]ANK67930.1 hypothetical protein AYR55_09665 [Loigolactobacillus backii]OLF69091.1 hypothetical protein ACX53_09780 [Loigolactobacillus backii]PIO86849.1 hypothetical protein B8A32_06685 [Loigolactobacillus backii]